MLAVSDRRKLFDRTLSSFLRLAVTGVGLRRHLLDHRLAAHEVARVERREVDRGQTVLFLLKLARIAQAQVLEVEDVVCRLQLVIGLVVCRF